MESANDNCLVSRARYISIDPKRLKEVATRMEFEAQDAARGKDKVMFRLTEDIVLYYDPNSENKK